MLSWFTFNGPTYCACCEVQCGTKCVVWVVVWMLALTGVHKRSLAGVTQQQDQERVLVRGV